MVGRPVEENRELGQRLLGLLQLQIVEQIAVVGATDSAEDDVPLIGLQVIGEPEARLNLAGVRRAVVPVADVVVDVHTPERQGLCVGLTRCQRVRVRADERGHHIGGRHEIQVGRRALVVPANTDVQGQFVGGRPVILQIDAELFIVGSGYRIQARHRIGEERLVGNARGAGGADVVEELRVDVRGVLRRELHPFVLDARLDRVIPGPPLQVAERQLVPHGVALLTLVLSGPRGRWTCGQDRLVVAGCELERVLRTVTERACRRRVERVLVRDQHLVEPAVGAALPASIDARVVIENVDAGRRRDETRAVSTLVFAAYFGGQHEAIIGGGLPVQLAEVEVLVEGLARRSEFRQGARRQLSDDIRRRRVSGSDRDRRGESLGLVGHEEMQRVLDDRSAEREPELLVLGGGLDVRVRGEFRGRFGSEILTGVGAEDLPFEPVGAGLGLGGYRSARDLVVLGLVVGGDHLVLADRELREGIALGEELPADTALLDVVLLAHAIDVHIHRGGVLRSALERSVAARVHLELHARHGVGELEEVAGELRDGLDLLLRNDGADLGGPHLGQALGRARDRDGLQLLEVQHRRGRDVQRDGLLRPGPRIDVVGPRRQTHDGVDAVGAGLGMARETGVDVLGRDFAVGFGLALQGGTGFLRPGNARRAGGQGERGGDERCDETSVAAV